VADTSQPEPQPGQPQPKANKRWGFFSERYGVLWTIITCIVAILFGYMIAQFGQQRKQIAYVVPSSFPKIFDRHAASPSIEVRTSDGVSITQNIYVAEITVWNAGNVAIEPGDAREQVRIVISPAIQILDLQVTKSVRPEIAHYSIQKEAVESQGQTSPKVEPKSVAGWLSWEHLDPGFAATFQITFSSDADSSTAINASMEGYVVGMSDFNRVDQKLSTTQNMWENGFLSWLILGLGGALTYLGLEALKNRRSGKRLPKNEYKVAFGIFIGLVLGYVAVLLYTIFFGSPTPPIG
jgi:hypothetical protein